MENRIINLLENWKSVAAIVLAIIVTVITIRTTFWDYADKAYDREKKLREREREEDNRRQIAMFRDVFRNDLDSMMNGYNAKLDQALELSIRKDSVLMIVLPTISKRINTTIDRVDRVDAKLSMLIGAEKKTPKIDFIRELNRRDSIFAATARRDSMDLILLREIRKANKALTGEPKFGDRAR